jgi:hypothetical protein
MIDLLNLRNLKGSFFVRSTAAVGGIINRIACRCDIGDYCARTLIRSGRNADDFPASANYQR